MAADTAAGAAGAEATAVAVALVAVAVAAVIAASVNAVEARAILCPVSFLKHCHRLQNLCISYAGREHVHLQ